MSDLKSGGPVATSLPDTSEHLEVEFHPVTSTKGKLSSKWICHPVRCDVCVSIASLLPSLDPDFKSLISHGGKIADESDKYVHGHGLRDELIQSLSVQSCL